MAQYKTKEEILSRGREAIGKRLADIDKYNRLSTAKGYIGHVIEESHFGYKINSNREADFKEAGVELKVTPYITRNKKYSAKERLVLNIINYMEEYRNYFETSSFWRKNSSLLLMFYEHIQGLSKKDFIISECVLYEYPEEDLLVIKADWEKIINKILCGKAHEISESDTNYLGACTKGRDAASSYRKQPFSIQKAKQRAYCLKQSYMTYLLRDYIFGKKQDERIVKDLSILQQMSFEDYIINNVRPYFGKSQSSLVAEFNIKSRPKNINEIIVARILGIEGRVSQTEEFLKANIVPKTIRVNYNGSITESMSFPAFDFKSLVEEDWENAEVRKMFEETRYMFIIFKYNSSGELILERVMFWGMPYKDLLEVKKVWELTKKVLREGVRIVEKNGKKYNNLPKASESTVAHVRPHARDSSDTLELPDGRKMPKQCFWLNNTYIQSQISSAD